MLELLRWPHVVGLDLLNDDTRPSGHISRPTQVNVSQELLSFSKKPSYTGKCVSIHSLSNYLSLIILSMSGGLLKLINYTVVSSCPLIPSCAGGTSWGGGDVTVRGGGQYNLISVYRVPDLASVGSCLTAVFVYFWQVVFARAKCQHLVSS